MKRRRPWYFYAILAAAVLFACYVVYGIIQAGNEPAPPPTGGQAITTKNGRVTGNRITTRSFTFAYKSAEMSADGVNASLNGVHDGIFYKKGKPYLKMSAKQISLNTQTLDFTAVGTVEIQTMPSATEPTRTFDTDLVQWTNSTKILLLSHQSIVRTGDELLKVGSITVDFNTDQIHLNKIEGAVAAPGGP